MLLKPSLIYFCQDSINNYFKSHGTIGSVLDKIYEGIISINTIPMISICQKDGKWFTADNRRLWIFQQLEKLGKCSEIDVQVTHIIPDNKFTTKNGGVSVTIRGDPGSKYAKDVSWRSRRGEGGGEGISEKFVTSDDGLFDDFLDPIELNSDDYDDPDDELYDHFDN
ncbi:hypothetical protein ACJMK2_009417 [Sinanodonta woodiana]|uniref:Uncharacterized protein n=1 Tax=Sinanodonta woodiana TaxID=1069815 RepID=A0ABD3VDV5_SINWO